MSSRLVLLVVIAAGCGSVQAGAEFDADVEHAPGGAGGAAGGSGGQASAGTTGAGGLAGSTGGTAVVPGGTSGAAGNGTAGGGSGGTAGSAATGSAGAGNTTGAAGTTGTGGAGGCPGAGQMFCNGMCINTNASAVHCGACNNACVGSCVNGTCVSGGTARVACAGQTLTCDATAQTCCLPSIGTPAPGACVARGMACPSNDDAEYQCSSDASCAPGLHCCSTQGKVQGQCLASCTPSSEGGKFFSGQVCEVGYGGKQGCTLNADTVTCVAISNRPGICRSL